MRDHPWPRCPRWCSGSRLEPGIQAGRRPCGTVLAAVQGWPRDRGVFGRRASCWPPALLLPLNWSMKAVLSTCAGRAGLGLRASRSGPCVPSGAGLCPQGQRGPCVPAQSAVLLQVRCRWAGPAVPGTMRGLGGSHPRHGCDRAPIPGPSSEGPGPGYPRDALRGAGSPLPAGRAAPGRAGPLWPRWQGRDVSATWPRGGAGGSDTRTGLSERVPGDTGGTGSGACRVSGYRGSAGCDALRVPRAPSHPCERVPAVLEPGQLPEPPPLSQRPVPSGPPADPRAGPAPAPVFPSRRSPRWRVRKWPVMLILLLLLLLGPAARAAPREGTNRPEPPVATIVDPYPDPLSLESPALLLLRSAVRSLGPPQRDVEAMTREQALLYLFVLHDHDQSRRLDGLELLQLLGTVLAQAGGQPDPDMVAALVDQALATQDLNGDGLLDPSELLDPPEALLPGEDQGPPGQPPLEQQAGAGAGAGPGGGAAMPRQDLGLRSPGQAATEAGDPKVESLKVESPNAEALEAEVIPEAEAPGTDAPEEEEAPEAEAPEEQAAPAWRDHGEG
ncbi:cell growth regulator with EF hand domain protein 1 [Poecile atricapillus]|uniref:cell growth regulator with EF hand domain protein 1 n=1 Tax=Poecile atricapillus TaxID=48891 RepID=UPI00273948BD|nr:cell growth regulator with EF hand domain protein 1 [Poecile atricapillus]